MKKIKPFAVLFDHLSAHVTLLGSCGDEDVLAGHWLTMGQRCKDLQNGSLLPSNLNIFNSNVDTPAAALLAEVDVLAAFLREEITDLLHERGGGLVCCSIARHLDGFGHEVADRFDLLNDKVLRLAAGVKDL